MKVYCIMKNLKSIINWIFSDKCISCSKEIGKSGFFCEECFKNIIFIDFPFCRCCGKILQTSYNTEMLCEICSNHQRIFHSGRSLFVYNEQSKRIIMRIKKEADEHIAKKCVKMLINRYGNIIRNSDLIIPIPSHFSRILKRGFNPATIIAKHISKLSGMPLNTNALKRIKRTKYQKNKTLMERQENVEGAFRADSQIISGKNILLVDDVMTTGATISECAKTLKESDANTVNFMTILSTDSEK